MAGRLLSRRTAGPFAAIILSTGAFAYPKTIYAESPEAESIRLVKRPIYDDPHAAAPPSQQSSTSSDNNSSSSSSTSASSTTQDTPPTTPTAATTPTPTDRLAAQIRRARLTLYDTSSAAEARANALLTRALNAESTVASTVASLAPPKTANEPLLPGLAYVLVSALAGSIITRNRGFLLRFTVPLAFGVAAAEAALPVTMGNVGELVWRWEQRYPELARRHIEARERVERLWETGKSHAAMSGEVIKEKADDARKGVEDWVKKGK